MLKWLTAFKNKKSLLLFVQSNPRPISLVCVHESTAWHKLVQKLQVATRQNKKIKLQQIQWPTQGISDVNFPQTSLQQNKIFLNKQGKIKQGTSYEDALVPIAVTSQSTRNRNITGVQAKWQWIFITICKFVIFLSIASSFNLLYWKTRYENWNKDQATLKRI